MTLLDSLLQCFTGIAFFLIGLNYLEEALKNLATRRFKLFLIKNTSNKISGLTIGTIATGIFQSSSVVNLITLSFLGSGLITLRNALSILLGTNLGSTISTWLLLYLGFVINFNHIAYSLTGVFGILMILFKKQKKIYNYCKLMTGFGMLFIGLLVIRESIQVKYFVLAQHEFKYPPIIFFFFGLLVTAIIQSTSLTTALTLSMLSMHSVSFINCAYIILGSEIGSSAKLIIASINGETEKKQLAFGNLIFNSIAVGISLIFFSPIITIIKSSIEGKNPLIGIAVFQSLVNIIGILIFFPITNKMADLLSKNIYRNIDNTMYLRNVDSKNSETSIIAVKKESKRLIELVILFTEKIMEIDSIKNEQVNKNKIFYSKETMLQYDYLKTLYGQIHSFSLQIKNVNALKNQFQTIAKTLASARNAMYAAKSFRNIIKDVGQLKTSGNEIKYKSYLLLQENVKSILNDLKEILTLKNHDKLIFSKLKSVHQNITNGYTEKLSQFYNENKYLSLSELELSTLVNVNRETYLGYKSILFAIKELMLEKENALFFDRLPGFIR